MADVLIFPLQGDAIGALFFISLVVVAFVVAYVLRRRSNLNKIKVFFIFILNMGLKVFLLVRHFI